MSIILTPFLPPRCATELLSPSSLPPQRLDTLLAQGWYRIGSRLIRCDYTTSGHDTNGAIWTRVPLEGYTWSKSRRRTRRLIEADFSVEVGPMCMDQEHEALYQRYLTIAPGERPSTLDDFLYGPGLDQGLFETLEVSIRDGDELIAFSWFDRGERSLQSLIGVFEPDYKRLSLGYYTMLREIQYGIDQGLDYFYAGYVLFGDSAMDYKLRTGHIECLDRTQDRWLPLNQTSLAALDPVGRSRRALERLGLAHRGWSIRSHEHHALGAYAPHLAGCVPYPLVLLKSSDPSHGIWGIAWDSVGQTYELMQCTGGSLTTQEGELLFDNILFVIRSFGHHLEDELKAHLALLGLS